MGINRKGLMEPPIYPCYKGEGLCQLRTETGKFECGNTAATCRYRKMIKVKDKEADEESEWNQLGRETK